MYVNMCLYLCVYLLVGVYMCECVFFACLCMFMFICIYACINICKSTYMLMKSP